MLIKNNVPYGVLLPESIWRNARDKDHFKQLLAVYMRGYPNYVVKRIERPYVLCHRKD